MSHFTAEKKANIFKTHGGNERTQVLSKHR
jgi:hypothetical protein